MTSTTAAPIQTKIGNEKLLKLTEKAGAKLGSLLTKQGRPQGALRVAVIGGGCSGLQYKMDAERHPDAAGGDGAAFTELNAAWQALREPAGCLRHFLELEHPDALGSAGQTPAELADLFMDIAAFRQAVQNFAAKYSPAT